MGTSEFRLVDLPVSRVFVGLVIGLVCREGNAPPSKLRKPDNICEVRGKKSIFDSTQTPPPEPHPTILPTEQPTQTLRERRV